MEPPSSILTDGKSKADPRSDDPLSCGTLYNHSLNIPGRVRAAGEFSCLNSTFFSDNLFLTVQIPNRQNPVGTYKKRYIFRLLFSLHSLHNRFCLSDTASRNVPCSDALLLVLSPPFSHLPYIIAV